MALTKILISVKTYPTLSEKYDELVCTAGFLEDGSWIRIYPIPFRKLDYCDRYSKWQWIELDLVKNTRDFRKESFRPANIDNGINILGHLDTKDQWRRRKTIALKNVRTDMSQLIKEAQDPAVGTSLAVLKPTEVIDFVWEPCSREWDPQKLQAVYDRNAQLSLFEEIDSTRKLFTVAKKLPYNFSYVFTTEDGIKRQLIIEDWELGKLFWTTLERANGDEAVACQKVKEKYFDYMVKERDLYFFLGTTLRFHNVGRNPFIIIGAFYPPKIEEYPSLF